MNTTLRNILILIGLALLVYLLWYFRNIIAYVLAAGVISLIGRPVVDLLNGIRIWKFRFPKALSSLLTLILLYGLLALFFFIFIPLIGRQIDALSGFDASSIVQGLREQIDKIDVAIRKVYKNMPADKTLYDIAVTTITNILNPASITDFAGNIVTVMRKLVVAFVAITFLAFFFLKDEGLFKETIMVLVPDQYEKRIRNVLHSIKQLLIRYFIGIILQCTIVLINITIGMTIVGFPFQQALVMGLLIGVFNVIPYVGPWLGGSVAVLMGVATAVTTAGYPAIWLLMVYMVIVIAITQAIDNNLIQPMIYSRSVNAHPIEIFLVIFAVGSFAGIVGMILAVPAYTALRVFAREFFYNFGPVRKITSGLGKENREPEAEAK
ncbi:MAG: AI-2E family transporter [Bacteroidales bacterium]|jgi:predicted PurR-regulated permease PerM|nr:AI-2E family transporter [Bacteroidales bacterium]NLD62763.1 AI-2E family transporter [Bacteroidales bacterium]